MVSKNGNNPVMVGHNLDLGFKRSGNQKEMLWDFFEAMKEHFRKHLKIELILGADGQIELAGPVGKIHLELIYVSQGEHVIQALIFFDNVQGPQGSIKRDLYAVRLNWNGKWDDATGNELAYEFDAHTPLAAFQMVQHAITAQLRLNGERVDRLMSAAPVLSN